MVSAPQFYLPVMIYTGYVLFVLTLVVEVVAFLHCLVQRSEAFQAIGTWSKGIWLLIIGGSALFVLLGVGSSSVLAGIVGLIPIVAALVYLLDVRPARRDGHGPW